MVVVTEHELEDLDSRENASMVNNYCSLLLLITESQIATIMAEGRV